MSRHTETSPRLKRTTDRPRLIAELERLQSEYLAYPRIVDVLKDAAEWMLERQEEPAS